MGKKIQRIVLLVRSLISWLVQAFDIRDLFVFSGMLLIWYGLYLWIPSVSFVVVGVLVLLLGLDVKGFVLIFLGGAHGGDNGRS
jgi:hypothetical protein